MNASGIALRSSAILRCRSQRQVRNNQDAIAQSRARLSQVFSQSRHPKRFRYILAHAIRDFDRIAFAQFLPLRSIDVDFNRTAIIDHPDFHDPLFAIGGPRVFDFLALFYRCHQSFPITIASSFFFSQPTRPINNSATTQPDTIDFFVSNLLCILEHL